MAAMSAPPDLTPDGRIGIVGISFAGGLSLAAAGRPAHATKWPSCSPSAAAAICRA